MFRETDRAGLGDSFQARGYIDSVAHQVTVALLDHIANMNANPEFNTAIFRYAGVAVDHRVLNLDGAAHGIDHAAKLDRAPSPVRLNTRPLCTEMVGSMRSLRKARSRAKVRSSSTPSAG